MPELPDLHHGQDGELVLPAHNRSVDAINRLGRAMAHNFDVETAVARPNPEVEARVPPVVEEWLGFIIDHPCDSDEGDDYTDCRYYVKRLKVTTARDAVLDGEEDDFLVECVTATNLGEYKDNTHRLTAGTNVHVFATYVKGNPLDKRYWFCLPPAGTAEVLFRLTGSLAGDECYSGKSFNTSSAPDFDGSTDPVDATLGTMASANDVIAINQQMWGETGHSLDALTGKPVVFKGTLIRTNSDGTKVVFFTGIQRHDCTTPT